MSVWNRMVVASLALAGIFVSTYLLLYSLGAMGTLICGVGGGCDLVQASQYAYFLGLPVAGWGLAGYMAIFAVALAGVQPSVAARRWVAIALLGLTGGAFLVSMTLTSISGLVIGAWCRWCLVSASLATLSFLFSLPEARRTGIIGRATAARDTASADAAARDTASADAAALS
jgi:uncharacterized membrane protein